MSWLYSWVCTGSLVEEISLPPDSQGRPSSLLRILHAGSLQAAEGCVCVPSAKRSFKIEHISSIGSKPNCIIFVLVKQQGVRN